MTDTEFKAWVDRLVQTSLPLELQKKLLTLQPLTKEEAQRYVNVILLVSQAKQLGQHSDIVEKIDALTRDSRRNGKLLRETLWHASGKLPQYKPKDARSVGVVKETMVQTAINLILGGSTTPPRELVNSVLLKYHGVAGAYDDLTTFMKQVMRVLRKSGHNFENMS